MASRRSSQVFGVPPEIVEQLAEYDAEFYGDHQPLSDTESDSNVVAPAQQADLGEQEEVYSESGEEAEPIVTAPADAADDTLFQEIRERVVALIAAGCGCDSGSTNHYSLFSPERMEKFMYDFRQLDKPQRKSFVLASLSACYRSGTVHHSRAAAEATGRTRSSYVYAALSEVICQSAYLELLSLSHHTLKSLQNQVKES